LRKQKKLVKEAIKAEYEEKLIVDKDEQTTLEESSKGPKLDKKGKKKDEED
jgi:hypothetical protein